MDFKDKVVLITGASGGIGAACALHFAKLSANLAIVGRNVEKLKHVAEECENLNGMKPLSIIADISKQEDNERIIRDTITHFGKIDVLVNNAGILLMAHITDDVSIYDRLFSTNVRGTYTLTQLAIPHLLETKGNIVIVSSAVSTVPMPAMTPYSMSKAALDMLTKCVALDLASKGVRVNSVNPGPVATNLFIAAGASEAENKVVYQTMADAIPLKKIASADDVANMVVFLASDSTAGSITGSTHMIDCGLHLGEPIVRG